VSADTGERAKPLYDWRAQSTYIRRPPYWEGAPAGERTLTGMRPLVVLGDNITTDHLSPSKRNSRRLRRRRISDEEMGPPEEDFNSYATQPGDHLTAQRVT
jgi:aconitate hydratase